MQPKIARSSQINRCNQNRIKKLKPSWSLVMRFKYLISLDFRLARRGEVGGGSKQDQEKRMSPCARNSHRKQAVKPTPRRAQVSSN
jgi:hypothetical protein